MEDHKKIYEVEEFSLGDKLKTDKIVFKTLEDLEQAYGDIDNGRSIYVSKDGLITKLLHQMISSKIYEGSILLSARE
ncbi:MAG: hypothetical protein ABIH00_09555 [Armatimonadota bacterium]